MTQVWDAASDLPAYPTGGPVAGNACHLGGIANIGPYPALAW